MHLSPIDLFPTVRCFLVKQRHPPPTPNNLKLVSKGERKNKLPGCLTGGLIGCSNIWINPEKLIIGESGHFLLPSSKSKNCPTGSKNTEVSDNTELVFPNPL